MALARLSPEMAQSFLAKLGEHIETNVNIMDRDGVIIASRDSHRVGTYHAAAHRLIESRSTVEIVTVHENLPTGVRPGVNLPLEIAGETVGVVGVSGDPALVTDLAYAVKTSVEAMAELERVKDRLLRKQSGRAMLVNRLIQHDAGPPAALAQSLGYDTHLARAPLLITLSPSADPEELWRALKVQGLRGNQDIGAPTADGDLLVFKTIDTTGGALIAAYENQVAGFAAALPATGSSGQVFAGLFQRDFSRYPAAYHQALWLRSRQAAIPADTPKGVPITRHVGAYLTSLVPRSELVGLFEIADALLTQASGADLRETLVAVGDRDFNLKETAHALQIHRNTLAARLDKIEALCGLDPRLDGSARDYYRFFVRYLQNTGHDAQY